MYSRVYCNIGKFSYIYHLISEVLGIVCFSYFVNLSQEELEFFFLYNVKFQNEIS